MTSIISSILFIAISGFAQTAAVKDIPADGETTISISKGDKTTKTFEIVDGASDIEGEPAPLNKEARNNWKKACTEWKAETKELNKENQLLVLNCGTVTCSKESPTEVLCKSKGTYKIKTKIK